MLGASLSAPLCREGEREGERERSDFTFLPFSPRRCRETHVSTSLRARGQEGQKGWDRYLGEKEKKKEEGLKKEREKVDCFLDEWGSTVLHEQENRDSFFGPWTDKSTHQSRSQDWKVKATSFVCLPLKKQQPGIPYR